jgi:hypothetical protein
MYIVLAFTCIVGFWFNEFSGIRVLDELIADLVLGVGIICMYSRVLV